jgi:hypothetical protein
MRTLVAVAAMTFLVCLSAASAPLCGEDSITPVIELQSGPLTPGLELDESPRPIHQVRLLVDAKLKSGRLILDGNAPEFDEFGNLVGGLRSPHVRDQGEAGLRVEIACSIELIKQRDDKWRMYRLASRELRTPLRVVTRGSIADGGPARLIVLGPDDQVVAVVDCVRYGLALP